MEVKFIKASPTENMTLLIETPVAREKQLAVAERLIAYGSVYAEQAGYIEEAENPAAEKRLQMMAGEFCGNASLSLAAWLAQKKNLQILDGGLRAIISHYTKEAGVRELERQIGKVCRKCAKKIMEGETETIRVTSKNITDFLGKKRFRVEKAARKDEVGIVRGLAWTEVGGDTLEIEVNTMPGEGNLKLTGQLGDVMKESAEIALSLVRALLPREEEFFKTHDFHLHVPEGAVPKDGPSAGVTMTTAIYSAVTGKKVLAKVAMTGEITLRGRVLPIGGLKEKLLAAKQAGIQKVVVPKENKPDVEELEEEITEGMQIVFAGSISDVLKEALVQK